MQRQNSRASRCVSGISADLRGWLLSDKSRMNHVGPCVTRKRAHAKSALFLYFQSLWRLGDCPMKWWRRREYCRHRTVQCNGNDRWHDRDQLHARNGRQPRSSRHLGSERRQHYRNSSVGPFQPIPNRRQRVRHPYMVGQHRFGADHI